MLLYFFFSPDESNEFDMHVRVGDKATFPCKHAKVHRDNCYSATWMYSGSYRSTMLLFEEGKSHHQAGAKSLRLRITANCSLVLKNITADDAGHYTCRLYTSEQQFKDYLVHLSVISSEY